MKNFLVTGCAGFIGSHLCEKLIAEGNTVVGIDNFDPFYSKKIKNSNMDNFILEKNFSFFEMDISDKKEWKRIPLKDYIVIHLAAKAGVRPSIENPSDYIQTNIIGTQLLLDWMTKTSNNKIVMASSSSVYGNNKKTPFSENDNVDFPISPYAYTKKSCELLAHNYYHLYNIDTVCLRFFTVYGPRQRPDLAIHKFVKLIDNTKLITLFGDGSSARDYTFIDDVIMGILLSINYIVENNHIYELINIGNNTPLKLIDLVKEIEVTLSKKAITKHVEMQQGDVNITFADISKAKELIGYEPKTNFTNGLKKFVEWYKK